MFSTPTSLSQLRDLSVCCSGICGVVGNREGKVPVFACVFAEAKHVLSMVTQSLAEELVLTQEVSVLF